MACSLYRLHMYNNQIRPYSSVRQSLQFDKKSKVYFADFSLTCPIVITLFILQKYCTNNKRIKRKIISFRKYLRQSSIIIGNIIERMCAIAKCHRKALPGAYDGNLSFHFVTSIEFQSKCY